MFEKPYPPIHIDFMLPGFSKCGTTTLSAMLNQHPALVMPRIKEPNLFSDAAFEHRWRDYVGLYPGERGDRLFGDDSTSYTTVADEVAARDRIAAHYPNCKMIFIARDPFKRIESSFREFHHSGPVFAVNADFDPNRAIQQFPAIIEDSMYYRRLCNYLERWPARQVLVVFLEHLVAQPERELHRCFEFLGVDPTPAREIALEQKNSAEEKLYDTRLLRYLRTHPRWGFKLARLTPAQQDRWLRPLGLRRVFKQSPAWNLETLAWIVDTLADDIDQFLRLRGETRDIWPTFASLCRAHGRPEKLPSDDATVASAPERARLVPQSQPQSHLDCASSVGASQP